MTKVLNHAWISYLRAARAAEMLGHSKHEDTRFGGPKNQRDQLPHPTQSEDIYQSSHLGQDCQYRYEAMNVADERSTQDSSCGWH